MKTKTNGYSGKEGGSGVKMKPFDKEEQKLMESIENEEWVSVDNLDEETGTPG